MQDIQRDRSIRNIPLPGAHRRVAHGNTPPPPQDYDDAENDEAGLPPPRRPQVPHRRSGGKWWLVGGAVVVCAVAGLLLSTVFEGAMVTITPKTVAVSVPQTLTAQPNGPTGTLVYQTVTAAQTATTTVTANGSQTVSRSATGVVTFYNTYSAASQTLIANTRLSTADGKIYRIKDPVTIPGVVKKPDGSLGPGTISVSITADKPGPAYNQTVAVPLTIPGFKGDPRYSKFIAQSQGAITGGFIGSEPAVSPADMSNAQNELKRQLDSSIRSVATAQIPEGFVAVNGSLGVTYTEVSQTPGSEKQVNLSQGATATIAIVRIVDLANALAKQVVEGYKGEAIAIGDLSKLTLSLTGNTGTNVTGPVSLTIGGTPTLVWQFDKDALKKNLLGKNKASFEETVKNFGPATASAQASIRPFWKATFPTDETKMTVTISQ